MRCHSLLFDGPQPDAPQPDAADHPERAGAGAVDQRGEPDYFGDVNLDQVVDRVTAGRGEYALHHLYYAPVRDEAVVRYRHAVLADLERDDVAAALGAFADQLRTARRYLAQTGRLRSHYQGQRWRLDAMAAYRDAVLGLADDLAALDLSSRGLARVREYVAQYAASETFCALASETEARLRELSEVTYCVAIKGNRVTVRPYGGEADLSEEIHATFAKFRTGAVRDYRVVLPQRVEMNHVEARILDLVAEQHPHVFAALEEHCRRHHEFIDPALATLERESQFYLAYLEHIAPLRNAGLPFCYPEVSTAATALEARDAFDLALAHKLARSGGEVVTNDVELRDGERALVVTGPNQGGKTTFARMVGELSHLAGLGLPVPGSRARLFLPDRIYTHFEREESLATLRGKLEDDLERMKRILDAATPDSLVIVNEAFTSTSVQDALRLSSEVLEALLDRGLLCVYVTFLDELSRLSEATVSLVTAVDPDDPAVRTFRVERRPADGLAYAAAIADKHGLTYQRLKERLPG